jgi:hypothetical protein
MSSAAGKVSHQQYINSNSKHTFSLNLYGLAAVDLETRRLEWDAQGIELVSNQEKAKRSRRVVADSTKGGAQNAGRRTHTPGSPLLAVLQSTELPVPKISLRN